MEEIERMGNIYRNDRLYWRDRQLINFTRPEEAVVCLAPQAGIVERGAEDGLVRGEEIYFDATKIEANVSLESITPRFAVE